jgi:hypothetical protein
LTSLLQTPGDEGCSTSAASWGVKVAPWG